MIHESTLLKTVKLESDFDHLSEKVERLCDQIDKSLPLLSEINLRMNDDIARRTVSEKIITKLVDNVRELSSIQVSHTEKLNDHSNKINELTEMSKIIASSGSYLKGLKWLIGFILLVAAGLYAYNEEKRKQDLDIDRNHAHELSMKEQEMEMKKLDLETKKLEAEVYEKKKKFDYTREKYLIRNGVVDDK